MPGTGANDDGGHEAAVVLVLRVPTGSQPVGEPVRVGVEIQNTGVTDLWVVGVLDGSEEGTRYPHYRPSVAQEGAVVAAPPPPEDPLVGPLREADFRRLGPGEAFDPTRSEGGSQYLPLSTFGSFRPMEPAVYRYTLTLSTESDKPEQWLGRFGQDQDRAAVLDLVLRIPRLTLTSGVDVEVR
jgi:hypothetical protein